MNNYDVLFKLHSAALKVRLSDKSMPAEDFSLVMGGLAAEWQRIGPYSFSAWC